LTAFSDHNWVRNVGLDANLGSFDWDRMNPNGDTVATEHPFGATGARDIS
jgi:acetyl-CoA C-acetyltransferase